MLELVLSETFGRWLRALKDVKGRAIILSRLDRLSLGNAGDAKSLGGGLLELRIGFGPGYRVYYSRQGNTLVLILAGGDKSTQGADIALARKILADWSP